MKKTCGVAYHAAAGQASSVWKTAHRDAPFLCVAMCDGSLFFYAVKACLYGI